MKEYNKYMDNISVSSTLHQKIMSRANDTRQKRWPIMLKHYTAAFACLAVVLLVFFTIPKLTQNNVTPTPRDNPSVLQPGSTVPAPYASSKFTLYFNKADSQAEDKIAIPGHFWRELTEDELKTVFPRLIEMHSITATANFQSDESRASLFNIDAQALSSAGFKIYIQLAPSEVVLDYGFDVETKASDVFGTAVTAGCFETKPNSKGLRNVICFATFKLSDVAYYVELGGREAEKEVVKKEISEIIGLMIEGGAADLDLFHPIVPKLRNDSLSLDEARADADFGSYIPETLPKGFVFENANRFINQERNTLFVNWTRGMNYISWQASLLKDNDKTRITNIADTENYDLALYPIPRADSVPDKLREIVDNPIFLIDELTLDTVRARSYEISDSGDEQGPRMHFSVLYENTLLELNVKGVTPEAIFEILQQIKK